MTEKKSSINRVKSTAKVSGIMDAFYESMYDGRLVCWCVGACPYEIFSVAGIARFQTENISARISAAQQQAPYIEYAEAHGLGSEVCSYTKINIGHALMMVDGLESQIPKRLRLPKPDMIFALNTCPTMIQWSNALVDIFKVPSFHVDAPFFYDEKTDWNRNIAYVKSQLEDLIIFIEKMTGKPYDWEGLKETLRGIQEMTKYRREILEYGKTVPAPGSFIDGAVAFGPANTVRDKKSIQFYKEYAEELAERVDKGIGVLPNEKYRIMWRGNFPWFKLGTLSRMLAKYDALLISGGYAFHNYGAVSQEYIPPDGFNLDDPLWTIAAEHCARSYTRTFEWKLEHEFRDFIDGFSIDAAIIHSPHTCRPWALAANDMAIEIEKEYGIPVLVLDSDHTDPSYFHDAQVETRIQALLEAVDAKRKSK